MAGPQRPALRLPPAKEADGGSAPAATTFAMPPFSVSATLAASLSERRVLWEANLGQVVPMLQTPVW